jgi:hypothetical protein
MKATKRRQLEIQIQKLKEYLNAQYNPDGCVSESAYVKAIRDLKELKLELKTLLENEKNIMTKRKWHKEIIAWAEGKQIQYRYSEGFWNNLKPKVNFCWDDPNYEFRIAPVIINFRPYVYTCPNTFVTYIVNHYPTDAIKPEERNGFVKWAGDWHGIEL